LHLPRSAGSLHRSRDARLAAYRGFGLRHGWSVLGLHEDLSSRYPVAPVFGARSAQAELALAGRWEGWDGLIASVLVLPRVEARAPRHASADLVVQFTVLDTGPDARQFIASWTLAGPSIVPTNGAAAESLPSLQTVLWRAGSDALRPGDRMAATEMELVHARTILPRQRVVDLEGPLHALGLMASELR
jgi:hypothetical protein